MFAVGGLLAIVQAGGVLLMPPSPRFYVLRGKYAEVRADTSDGRIVSCYSTFLCRFTRSSNSARCGPSG